MTLAKEPTAVEPKQRDINPQFLENNGFKKALQVKSYVDQYRTPEGLEAREHEGWFIYQEPSSMHWHMVAPDGTEPLGVATQRYQAERIISDHNRRAIKTIRVEELENDRQQTQA